ncbi:hypothetical protein Cgig2_011054 [Carnegiea gigantea]|uniref:Uncharacterized protein n=1 Tax=Carnegiea gigantea TaxID=171969 RepID=A0A9Q1GH76_9CARY|nr:hypothetical protein Cgig2_011054 [Carnegiea gigantea]
MVTSSLAILGESEVLEAAKSQDLTKSWTRESLAAGSALMKLVDGRCVLGGEPIRGTAPAVLEGKVCSWKPRLADFLTTEGRAARLPLPLREKVRMPLSRPDDPQSVAACRPSVTSRDHEKRGMNKAINCTFLACWVMRRCLSSSRRHSASAATGSGVASPISKTVNLALACST